LHQVFGIRGIPRHTEGGGVQLIQVRHDISLKALAALG
jgi:hypothetical protein